MCIKIMSKKKIYNFFNALIILFVIVAMILPVNFKGRVVYSEADEINNLEILNDSEVVWDSDKTITGTITINPLGVLIIKNGVTISFNPNSHIIVNGKLFINGTTDKPIYLKRADPKYGYSIWINDGGRALVKHADVSGPGMQIVQIGSPIPFINTVYAGTYQGGFSVRGGELEIQNSKIHDGQYGVGIETFSDPEKVVVQRSSFFNNQTDAYNDSTTSEYADKYANFSFNWWGNENGPSQECYMVGSQEICYYDKASGNLNFEPFRVKEDFHDPVIIVPGILGSWKLTDNGDWKMDPVFHTYDSLYDTFKDNGYTEDVDLFTFPYQWRDDNEKTADLLKKMIQAITDNTGWPKVDIVAHSMGGLVARQYIESDDYQNDIDQLIMLGTPNIGAPEDYLTWEGGEIPPSNSSIARLGLWYIFYQEAKEFGFDNVFDYLHKKPIESVQQLLPDCDYLYDVSLDKLRSYSSDEHYPKNSFLDKLNLATNLEKLNEVSVTNIIGKLGENTTIDEIKVGKPSIDEDSIWAHGEPIEDAYTKSDGDGTVPLRSAQGVPYDEEVEINSSHMNLPGNAKDIAYKELTGYSPKNDVLFMPTDKRLFFFALSPIDIQIIAPDGVHWIGKNINGLDKDNQIKGAYYTGYDTENEFATIPNPEDGEYQIVTEGTGNGEYTVEVAKISEDENNPGQATESVAKIVGTAVEDETEESSVTVSGDEVTTESVDTISPSVTVTVFPEPNESGWNKTDVTVHFEATDDSGEIASITPDVTLSEEKANQIVTGEATDAAGNVGSVTTREISIDKTAPITIAKVLGTVGENKWYQSNVSVEFANEEDLSGVEKTFYTVDDDKAKEGSVLTITENGLHQVKFHSQDFAGNIEEEKTLTVKIDRTAPTVEITSPKDKNYKNSEMLPIAYSASDEQSATDKLITEIFYDGQITNQNKIDLSLEKLGAHSVYATATDEAGNQSAETKINFMVATDIGSILQNTRHYYSLGLIKNRTTEFLLEIKLLNIQESMRLLDTFNNRWMPRWARERVAQNIKRSISRQIDDLKWQLQRNRALQKTIDGKVRGILVEDLEMVNTH